MARKKFLAIVLLTILIPIVAYAANAKWDNVVIRNALGVITGPVGIGIAASQVNPDAILQVNSTSQAILLPQLTFVSRAALSNTAGLFMYNSDSNALNYNNGTSWSPIATQNYNSSTAFRNGEIRATVASNNLTIALKVNSPTSGSDPSTSDTNVGTGFQNTVTAGAYRNHLMNSARSIVVPSGGTLGCESGVDCYLYVYLVDITGSASGVEVGVSRKIFDEGTFVTTTAVSGSSSSAFLIYATTAASTRPVRLIGRILINEASAGVWATAPTRVRLIPFQQANVATGSPGAITKMGSAQVNASCSSIVTNNEIMLASCATGGTGVMVHTFRAGYFNGTPVCMCNIFGSGSDLDQVCRINLVSSTSVTTATGRVAGDETSLPTSLPVSLICIGPN